MATYIGLPLDPEYLKLSEEVVSHLDKDKAPPQARAVVKSTKILIASMMHIMIDDLIKKVKMKPFAKKVIKQVGNLMQKTVNVLIDKVISKLNNRDLKPVVENFKDLEIDYQGGKYLAFEASSELAELIDECYRSVDAGETERAKKQLLKALLEVTNVSLEIYLIRPMSLIRLGPIARKVVDFVSVTIQKAVPPALKKIIPAMDQEELESFRDFIDDLILRT